jgi:hypothetical protein
VSESQQDDPSHENREKAESSNRRTKRSPQGKSEGQPAEAEGAFRRIAQARRPHRRGPEDEVVFDERLEADRKSPLLGSGGDYAN